MSENSFLQLQQYIISIIVIIISILVILIQVHVGCSLVCAWHNK